jgi:hypothetical protein
VILIDLNGGDNEKHDFTEGKFDGIKFYPELGAYLFSHKHELDILGNLPYIVYGPSVKSHVYLNNKPRFFNFNACRIYDCRVTVATIM